MFSEGIWWGGKIILNLETKSFSQVNESKSNGLAEWSPMSMGWGMSHIKEVKQENVSKYFKIDSEMEHGAFEKGMWDQGL